MVENIKVGPNICNMFLGMTVDELKDAGFVLGYDLTMNEKGTYFLCRPTLKKKEVADDDYAITFFLVSGRVSQINIVNWRDVFCLEEGVVSFSDFVDKFIETFLRPVNVTKLLDCGLTLFYGGNPDWDILINKQDETILLRYKFKTFVKF